MGSGAGVGSPGGQEQGLPRPAEGPRSHAPLDGCAWSVQNEPLKDGKEQRLLLEAVKWAPDRVRVLRGSVPTSPPPLGPCGQPGQAERRCGASRPPPLTWCSPRWAQGCGRSLCSGS